MSVIIDGRVFERVEGKFAVRYLSQGSNREVCTTTKNISGGGVRMSLSKRLNLGTVLDLEIFRYNTDIKAICRGKIVWVEDKPMNEEDERFVEAGIQFINQQLLHIGGLISCLRMANLTQKRNFDMEGALT